MKGATVIVITFQGGVIPATLPVIGREPLSLNIPRPLFPPRGVRRGPFTVRLTYPELADPSIWETADARFKSRGNRDETEEDWLHPWSNPD
jgi:hypothetical protein